MSMLINFLYATIRAGTPLLFGTTGEILSERAGNLNLGVEGMMWLGGFAGFYAAYKTENLFLAMLAAFGAGALGALLYAFLTVSLRANQNVTGLTLTTFGTGLSLVLGYSMAAGGAPILSESFMQKLARVNIPLLSDIPYVGEVLFQHSFPVYLAIIIAVVCAIYYKKTNAGLSVRAVGENPSAADAAGINVALMKYIHIVAGGGICGLGGAFMTIVLTNGSWQPAGVVNGKGWIAVALVIFASWSPLKAILGAFVFGAFDSLGFYIPSSVIVVPRSIYQMLPFVLTTVVLVVSSIRKKKSSAQPAACGTNYFREER